MSNNWHKVWDLKNISDIETNGNKEEILDSLLLASGYNKGTNSSVTHKEYLQFMSDFVYPKVSDCESFFEVGCGCGAFLYALNMTFESNAKNIERGGGSDFSSNFVSIAKKLLPKFVVLHEEANALSVDEKYDCVLSFGVFLYFLNLEYAKEVLSKMVQKANKKVLIMEIPNKDKQSDAMEFKRKICGENYQTKYGKGYEHLYYSKDFFIDFAKETNLKCEIKEQDIKNYSNSKYRFNVTLEK